MTRAGDWGTALAGTGDATKRPSFDLKVTRDAVVALLSEADPIKPVRAERLP